MLGDLADNLFAGALAVGLAAFCAWILYCWGPGSRSSQANRKPPGRGGSLLLLGVRAPDAEGERL